MHVQVASASMGFSSDDEEEVGGGEGGERWVGESGGCVYAGCMGVCDCMHVQVEVVDTHTCA